MKTYLFTLLFAALLLQHAHGQQRKIVFQQFGADSLKLSFNKDYYFLEDSCAQIVRYTRMNFQTRKYIGHFKDSSRTRPGFIISEGNYNANGLKDGEFTEYYLNGNLLAKGAFKDGEYAGKWDVYYEDGQPRLTFEANGKVIRLIDAWDSGHHKIVDKGTGFYSVPYFGHYVWTGNIAGGRPDGDWICVIPDKNEPPVITEVFSGGNFVSGKNLTGTYTDSSKIVLVDKALLPLVNAEKMLVSRSGCGVPVADGPNMERTKVENAKYEDGNEDFTQQIEDATSGFFRGINWTKQSITITGEINEKGALVNLTSDRKNEVRSLILALGKLPLLKPATINGKPTTEGFSITFLVNGDVYSFSYKFLGIKAPSQ